MRRLTAALLLLLMLFAAGCSLPGNSGQNRVTFYYPRSEFRFSEPDGVIAREIREMPGRAEDISYVLGMYLMGPETEGLDTAFPTGTRLMDLIRTDGTVTLSLNQVGEPLPEIRFAVAAACIGKTCLGLCPDSSVTIICGERTLTLNEENLLLSDDGSYTTESGGST